MQRLVFANNGEQRLAVHEAHIVHDPPGDGRISIVPVGRKEDDLHIADSVVSAGIVHLIECCNLCSGMC